MIQTIGTPVGCGLIEESAIEMNLPVLTPVATGINCKEFILFFFILDVFGDTHDSQRETFKSVW